MKCPYCDCEMDTVKPSYGDKYALFELDSKTSGAKRVVLPINVYGCMKCGHIELRGKFQKTEE